MPELRQLSIPGHETILEATDPTIGYHAFVVIHSTRLGPAVGGTRFLQYPSEAAAPADGLRLAEGMTLKAALAGMAMGGGKTVMLQPTGSFDREALYRAHGGGWRPWEGVTSPAETSGPSGWHGAPVLDEPRLKSKTRYPASFAPAP